MANESMRLLEMFAASDADEGTRRIRRVMGELYESFGVMNGNQLYKATAKDDTYTISRPTATRAYSEPEQVSVATLRKVCAALGVDFDETINRIMYDVDVCPSEIEQAYERQLELLRIVASAFLTMHEGDQNQAISMLNGMRREPTGTASFNARLPLRQQVHDALGGLAYPHADVLTHPRGRQL